MIDPPPPLSRAELFAIGEHAQTDVHSVRRFLAGRPGHRCGPRIRAALVHFGYEAHLAAADKAATIAKGGSDDGDE